MPDFGVRLKELRQQKKMTQRALAEHLGITDRTYQYYEVGRVRPPYETLLALASFFGVSLDYLVGLTDTPQLNTGSSLEIDEELRDSLQKIAQREMRTLENQVTFFLKRSVEIYSKANDL